MLTDLENSVALPDHRESIEPLHRERCAGCRGSVYQFDEVHDGKRFCFSCWEDFHFCVACDTRIFVHEITHQGDYFHPECFEEVAQ